MVKLNLPAYEYTLNHAEGKVWIFDLIRKRFVVLTPEEWVRQHVLNFLITQHHYPKSLMRIERGVEYNQLNKRFDLVVCNRDGKAWMVVECKAPSQKINQKTLQQASIYNATFKARFLMVTNGIELFCFSTDWENKKIERLQSLPEYGS